jgi:hypothetical protein
VDDPSPRPIANLGELGLSLPVAEPGRALRTLVRALDGMQKEAIVVSSETGRAWRLVSDEGPYLNGTDLAPPPLGFFCAGMAAAHANAILAEAAARDVRISHLRLVQDTYYSMEGSALRGTMTGGAAAPELEVEAGCDLSEAELAELAREAVATSPVAGLVRGVHESAFALVRNGEQIETGRVHSLPGAPAADPREWFERAEVGDAGEELLRKVAEAEQVQGEGGAGSSLRSEQSRTLHVRAVCTIRDDGTKVIDQILFSPVGSQFRLLSAEEGQAPDALTLLSAGIGFCYMTQLGRYATITRRPLDGYRIVQDTRFSASGGRADVLSARALPHGRRTRLLYGDARTLSSIRVPFGSERKTCRMPAPGTSLATNSTPAAPSRAASSS